jgi:hypothetical protein
MIGFSVMAMRPFQVSSCRFRNQKLETRNSFFCREICFADCQAGSNVGGFGTVELSSALEADLVPSAFDRKDPAQLTVTAPEDELENPK